jgi:prepilin-type N-terminal cleavage/methylation domain-containing protein
MNLTMEEFMMPATQMHTESPKRVRRFGFTLVELLVVIALIALLIAMLLPSLSNTRRQALSVACKANLRTNYQFMYMYANDNHGWYAPMGLGHNPGLPREKRWPAYVFKPAVWNPPTMLCPADHQPEEEHSYILNDHVLQRKIRVGKTGQEGLSPSDIILMGEKKSDFGDYYMEYKLDASGKPVSGTTDFWRLVEKYRHGIQLGSNYLMLDGSVISKAPKEAEAGMDPWDPVLAAPTPEPEPPVGGV